MISSIRQMLPISPGAPSNPLSLDEIKAVELGILDAFDAWCAKHSLTYWLAWGTLIGAIRHRGFIPWDDDIDVAMPWDDFTRMIDLANAGDFPDGPYHFGSNKIHGAVSDFYAYVKLYDMRTRVKQSAYRSSLNHDEGVWIDIFPLVGASVDEAERRRFARKSYRSFTMNTLCAWNFMPGDSPAGTLRRALIYPYARLLGYRHWLKAFDRLLATYPRYGSTPYCTAPPYDSVTYQLEDFAKTVEVEFEQGLYPAPSGYDHVLRADFGDYMQPPPEEQRVSNHEFTAVWR
jgi:lipopolysaccharide cholinephosphotransferase